VGSIATGGIVAASFATDSIAAAAIKADAATEIGTAVWASTTRQLTATGLDLILSTSTYGTMISSLVDIDVDLTSEIWTVT
jgi:hypothetical protein